MKTLERPPRLRTTECGRRISRRRLLRIGGASVAGAALFSIPGCGGEEDGRDEAAPGDTRKVEHALGETEIPESPERVVTLGFISLDCVLAVGVRPVGAPIPSSVPAYLRDRMRGISETGDLYAADLESIALAEPDLILASSSTTSEELKDELSRVAPTAFIDDLKTEEWKGTLAKVAGFLGKSGEGERWLMEWDRRVEEFQGAMGERLDEVEVSVVRPREDGIRLYGKTYFPGVILEEIGLPRPPAQDVEESRPIDISKELIRKAEGDAMFVWSFTPEEQEERGEILEDPLWSTLEVVRRGAVYEVGAHWYGGGPLAASAALDDLEKHLLGEQP